MRCMFEFFLSKKNHFSIAFLTMSVDTSGHIYDDFIRVLFLYAHREAFSLDNELPEESDQFRFLHDVCLPNLKGSVTLILPKTSDMRISIPIDLSVFCLSGTCWELCFGAVSAFLLIIVVG